MVVALYDYIDLVKAAEVAAIIDANPSVVLYICQAAGDEEACDLLEHAIVTGTNVSVVLISASFSYISDMIIRLKEAGVPITIGRNAELYYYGYDLTSKGSDIINQQAEASQLDPEDYRRALERVTVWRKVALEYHFGITPQQGAGLSSGQHIVIGTETLNNAFN